MCIYLNSLIFTSTPANLSINKEIFSYIFILTLPAQKVKNFFSTHSKRVLIISESFYSPEDVSSFAAVKTKKSVQNEIFEVFGHVLPGLHVYECVQIHKNRRNGHVLDAFRSSVFLEQLEP